MKSILLLLPILMACLYVHAQTFSVSATATNSYCITSGGCGQGVITASVSNATSAVTFSVLPSSTCHTIVAAGSSATISNVAAGTYSVIATNASGSMTATTVTVINAAGSLYINSTDGAICSGGITQTSELLSATLVNTGAIAGNYCACTSNLTGLEDITNVTIGSFSNSSVCGAITNGGSEGMYSNYTDQVINLSAGNTYPISITIDTCSNVTGATNSTEIYIDLNIDGDFNDPLERVYGSAVSYNGAHTETGTINIPTQSKVGYTRMRVINQQGSASATCGVITGGEVEDYTVNLNNAGNTTWQWSNGANIVSTTNSYLASAAGIYNLTATDVFGCTYTASAVILGQTAPTLNILMQNSSCANASLEAIIGNGPASVLWQPGNATSISITNLSTGTYTCTATNAAGCAVTSTSSVTPFPPIKDSGTVVNNVICSGANDASIITNISGGVGVFFYSWSPGASSNANLQNIGAGIYTLVVTDGIGCSTTFTYTITQSASPLIVGMFVNNISSTGANDGVAAAIASGGAPPYTYYWQPTGSTSSNITNCSPNIYTVTVTDSKGCSVTGTADIYNPGAQALGSTEMVRVQVRPNPCSNNLQVIGTELINSVEIINMQGLIVARYKFTHEAYEQNMDVSKLSNGAYLLRCNGKHGDIMITKN